MNEEILKLFFSEKATRIFLAIEPDKEKFGSQVRNEVLAMYSYTIQTLRKLRDLGLLEQRKERRRIYYSLTEKGEELRKQLLRVLE